MTCRTNEREKGRNMAESSSTATWLRWIALAEAFSHVLLLGMPPERFLGDSRSRRRLRLDTYGHDPIHAADIRRWREGEG